jgi:fatty acid desaturase
MAREDHQRLSDASSEKRNESNKEILEKLDQMEKSLHERITQQTKRINALENWRYYMMGVGAVLLFLVAKLN